MDLLARQITGVPIIALASYPRSGNTWTRQMIELATGYCTSSIHVDSKMTALGMIEACKQQIYYEARI